MLKRLAALLALSAAATTASACPTGFEKASELNGRTICRFASNDVLGAELSKDDPDYENKMTKVIMTAEFDYILVRQAGATDSPIYGTYIGADNRLPVKLVIEPGVTIYGNENTFMSVSRGSRIVAEGTVDNPIVFTTSKAERQRGLWGGLILNGNATTNAQFDTECGGVKFEGVDERKICSGGTNDEDSSGVLRYVRVEFGGYPLVPDKEINGFTFNAVGNGGELDYLQAHMIADDCFEFFGGSADARHLICTGGDDDGIDTDLGYHGRIQYAIIQYAKDKGDNAFEWNSNDNNPNATPRTAPMIANVTAIGGPVTGYGMLLRKGVASNIMNSVFTGFKKACIDIDDPETTAHGQLLLTGTAIQCAKNYEQEEGEAFSVEAWFNGQLGNQTAPFTMNGFAVVPGAGFKSEPVTPDDLFFDATDFIGAIENAESDWTAGWTVQLTADQLP